VLFVVPGPHLLPFQHLVKVFFGEGGVGNLSLHDVSVVDAVVLVASQPGQGFSSRFAEFGIFDVFPALLDVSNTGDVLDM
jgi:hypothetical protein